MVGSSEKDDEPLGYSGETRGEGLVKTLSLY
jgi:hypothetical protein